MDNGGGGCCIARYGGAGGGGGGGYDISTIDRIMRKFRPIAPKPAQGPSSSPEMSESSGSSGRVKRRSNGNINRRCNNGNNNRKRKTLTAAAVVVTLPLLPETPERGNIMKTKESAAAEGTTKKLPIWSSFGSKEEMMLLDRTVAAGTPEVMTMMTTVVISSCVTVECVTDTWVDVDGLGCTDGERRMNLERDRCPGFISDGFGRVTWTNDAYRKMATGGASVFLEEDGKVEVAVRLAVKDTAAVTAALASNTAAFTCRVRVQNQRSCGNYGKEKSSITLPCDVWRMDGGGFSWRLDVTAALSLGR